jgi:glucokinase
MPGDVVKLRTVGIDIGGTNIKIAALWNDGRVISAESIPTCAERGPIDAAERILATIHALLQREGIDAGSMHAVGMDCAGIVDPVRNVVIDSPNLRSWENDPLAQRIADRLGVPVYLENDVNAMAYGEWRCGAGRGANHIVCLTLGTGVGGGLILDGRLYRGAHGAAGELGHTTLDLHGASCTCPNSGCLERHVGAAYIVERALRHLEEDPTPSRLRDLEPEHMAPRDLTLAADAGDPVAAAVLRETGELLGKGLVSFVNIFNPERIVVGGGITKAGDRLLEPARRIVRLHAMSLPASMVEIVPAELGDDAAVVGATLLALEQHPTGG